MNVRTRCGCSPCPFQMRRTLAGLMPATAAMLRVLQWVAFGGFSRSVSSTTPATVAWLRLGFRPGRLASFSRPGTPATSYRWRQRLIVGVVVCSRYLISPVDTPALLSKTIFARRTTFCGVPRARTNRSNSLRSTSGKLIFLLVLIRTAYHK